MWREKLSFGLSVSGIIFAIGIKMIEFLSFAFSIDQGKSVSVYNYIIVGVNLFALFGVLIEKKKSLIAGSLICLISGALIVIISIIGAEEFYVLKNSPTLGGYIYLCFPSFLLIAGGVFGIWEFLRLQKNQ